MTNYKKLKSMGINSPEEIESYYMTQWGKKDILHLRYKRGKGSLLPISKKFKFSKTPKGVRRTSHSGKHEVKTVYEISSFLTEVIEELNDIVTKKQKHIDIKKLIEEDIKSLQKDVDIKLEAIKELIKKLN